MGIITLLRAASHVSATARCSSTIWITQTLIEAQKHPEEHRDLIVRVAGYSAFFTELCKDVQDEIISRTMLTKF